MASPLLLFSRLPFLSFVLCPLLIFFRFSFFPSIAFCLPIFPSLLSFSLYCFSILFPFMDKFLEKTVSLQESLSNLTLNPLEGPDGTKLILIGKIILTWTFRRFTLTEITQKMWKLGSGLDIEKIEENLFKFVFRNKQDKDQIFINKP